MPPKPKQKLSRIGKKVKKAVVISTIGLSALSPQHGKVPQKEPPRIVEIYTKKPTIAKNKVNPINISEKAPFEPVLKELIKARGRARTEILKQLELQHASQQPILINRYIELAFKEYNLDPIYGKAIFFNRIFNLKNPLGLESPSIFKRLGVDKKTIKDPFTYIDLTLQYISSLKKNNPNVKDLEIFARYLYGPSYKSKLKHLSELIGRTRNNYNFSIAEFSNTYRARILLSEYNFNARVFIKKSLSEFKKLSKEMQKLEIKSFVENIAPKLDLDPEILLRMISIESKFNYLIESPTNAKGLMQVKDVVLAERKKHIDFKKILGFEPSPKDLLNPYVNLVVGAYHIKYLIELYGSLDVALMVYTIGPGNYIKMLEGNKQQEKFAKEYVRRYYAVDLNKIFSK